MTHPFFDRDLAADLGANIRHLREADGLALEHLAARCGMAPARLAAAEAGAELLEALEVLSVMGRLRCSYGDLFDRPRADRGPS